MESLFSEILDKYYNISVTTITEQEGGWSALAFKVDTTSGIFFLKAYDKHRMSTDIWTATIDTYMPIVIWLNQNTNLKGRIVSPVLTNEGQYKCEDDRFIIFLFPYIEGYTLCDKPKSDKQNKEMAEIIAELHQYNDEIPVSTDAIKEDFAVPFCHELKEIISSIELPSANETLNILKANETVLYKNIEITQKLASKLSKENLPHVLCHTDVHGWNLMQSDRLILIDWEGMKLAPPEADLFAFIDNLFWHNCSAEFMEIYKKAHPNYEINVDALTFYQIRRKIEDICAFAQGLLYEDIDEEERKQSLYHLRRECSMLK